MFDAHLSSFAYFILVFPCTLGQHFYMWSKILRCLGSSQPGVERAALAPPQYLFLIVNQRCNLRCRHCAYWALNGQDRARYLTLSRRQELLAEFAALSPGAAVVICGGESMLDLEDYFGVAAACRRNGLRCLSVVNGTCIRDDAMADRMIREGPTEISVSLNSHREALHDETRGVPGAFRMATTAVRLLREARARQAAATRTQMRKCNRYCGISHSVRRVNATCKPGAPTSR